MSLLRPNPDSSALGWGPYTAAMTFADVLGYCFRKKVALSIERQSIEHDVVDRMPKRVRDDREMAVSQRPWTGGGPFDEFRTQCPFPFTVWFLTVTGEKFKVRSAMDVTRTGPSESYGIPHGVRGDLWWEGAITDVWLKTSMLTFNRAFPHEINRFTPVLCEVGELQNHLKFASMFGLDRDFRESYLAGLPENDRSHGAAVLATAER